MINSMQSAAIKVDTKMDGIKERRIQDTILELRTKTHDNAVQFGLDIVKNYRARHEDDHMLPALITAMQKEAQLQKVSAEIVAMISPGE